MKIPFIFLQREIQSELAIHSKAFEMAAASGMYILGENVDSLEKSLASYLGVKYIVAVNSGTDALFLSLKALEIMAGDEVITVGNSFIATIGAVIAVGATPVLVDVLEDRLIDPAEIEKKITPRTKAIIPVHLTGRPANMQHINDIAKQHGISVIDDAAQSFGASYLGKKFFEADAACYSFHPLKNFHCLGDGGAIATNNEVFYKKLLLLRNHGLDGQSSACFGYNSRLDEIQAAFLLNLLPYLDEKLMKRRQKARQYIEALKNLVRLPAWDDSIMEPAFQTFVVQTERRDELAAFLQTHEIETKIHYPVPCHKQEAWLSQPCVSLPETERQAGEILSIPISHLLTEQEQQDIIACIRSFFK